MIHRTIAAATEGRKNRVVSIGRLKLGATAIMLLLAVTGGPALGVLATGSGPAPDTTRDMAHTDDPDDLAHADDNDELAHADDSDDVTVEIDCHTSQVRVTAPADYEYGLTVVEVSQLGTSTSTSTQTPLSGNTTVEGSDAEVVYAFVTDASTGEPVTTSVEQCEEPPGTDATTGTDDPSVAIDCNESTVRFTAPEDVSYTARVSSIDVSQTGASTSTVSRTAEGNTTVPVEDELVIAFIDAADEPALAIEDCSRIDGDDGR